MVDESNMILKLTKHAKERMVSKGVTKEQIKKVIRQGARIRQTDGFESSYSYILVDWKKRGNIYIVKTIKIKD